MQFNSCNWNEIRSITFVLHYINFNDVIANVGSQNFCLVLLLWEDSGASCERKWGLMWQEKPQYRFVLLVWDHQGFSL